MVKLIFGLALLVTFTGQAATWRLTYPRAMSESDQRSIYPVKLLALALEKTGVRYSLKPSERIMLQNKALKRLMDSRDVNVVWSVTDKQREQQLLPIRIPIYKGLIGWRLLLIRDDMPARFKYVQKLEHLIKLIPIQGRDWPDTKILQANGFNVTVDNAYGNLFNLLRRAQGDFFPRSVVEVWDEIDNPAYNMDLMVEQEIAIRYPEAMYFFVNKKSRPLASLIEKGLEIAIADGSFEQLFVQTFQGKLDRANMPNRHIFELENSFLPTATPLERKELWYDPDVLKLDQ
ncbi:amino acid ABC transporter substrate-binding protein [uncultured Paraglaciecola sp.]|uniref:amino acid ABC transporter substrate-binding protein n=1 Tax=uncultured Paraglaciecola sp. TaxID=1765024 RepID=UPI0030DCF4B7